MSARNGDRARFYKDRKRKLQHRRRIKALKALLKTRAGEKAATDPSSLNMEDQSGPTRVGG